MRHSAAVQKACITCNKAGKDISTGYEAMMRSMTGTMFNKRNVLEIK